MSSLAIVNARFAGGDSAAPQGLQSLGSGEPGDGHRFPFEASDRWFGEEAEGYVTRLSSGDFFGQTRWARVDEAGARPLTEVFVPPGSIGAAGKGRARAGVVGLRVDVDRSCLRVS